MIFAKQRYFFHVLVLSILFSIGFCYCDGSFTGSYEACTFNYGYQDPNCTQYRFDECLWVECVSYVTIGNDTHCVDYQTFYDSNWVSCSNRCCFKQFPNQYASFQQCDDHVKSVVIQILIIVFAVIGGIIGVVIIICIICKCRDQLSGCFSSIGDCFRALGQGLCYILTCGCIRSLANRPGNPQIIELSNEHISRWKSETLRSSKLDEVCCICLEPSPSLQLGCRHIYHRSCILACLAKKDECALCRSTDIQQVKVYCESCFSKSYTLNIKGSQDSIRNKQQFCDLCKESNL